MHHLYHSAYYSRRLGWLEWPIPARGGMVQDLVRRLGSAALVAVALLLSFGVAPTSAQADDVRSSSSGDGILSGNSMAVDVDAPVSLCGLINGLVVGGIATGAAFCGGAEPVTPPSQAQSSA